MNFPAKQYPHSELTGQIIASAQRVHRELRAGLVEKIYENALCVDFTENQIHYSQQSRYPVHYHNQQVVTLIPDLVVENKVIVDTKVVESFHGEHISQLLSYLSITGLEVGLLLNFKHQSLQVKRIANLKN